MKLSDFKYALPQELIAQYPLEKRDEARLMVVDRKKQTLRHDIFSSLGRYLAPGSTFVLNDSKVIPARLFGKRAETGGKVEVFLLNRLSDGYSYKALVRPLKKLKPGEKIIFNGNGVYAQLTDPQRKIIKFNERNIGPYLEKIGHMPLPPYIKRGDEPLDRDYYQTVYARHEGSVAAPTAGLHFTREMLGRLRKEGHKTEKVTLHVNYATFKPVTEEDVSSHRMHSESYSVSDKSWWNIQQARKNGEPIVAVGTTGCRVLETVGRGGKLKGETDIFIYPGFPFRMTDALITNFHLPASTLFMLVCAFATRDLMMEAYAEAIREKYRFYSYGDCMLII